MITKFLSLPGLLFPDLTSPVARWLAMVPVLGALASCWGTAFLRFGGVPTATFTATVLSCLGLGLLVGLRQALRAIAARFPHRPSKPAPGEEPLLVFACLMGVGLAAGAGMGVMAVFTGGSSIDSVAAPGLAPPAQIGIWLWLAHEIYLGWWYARRRLHEPAQ